MGMIVTGGVGHHFIDPCCDKKNQKDKQQASLPKVMSTCTSLVDAAVDG